MMVSSGSCGRQRRRHFVDGVAHMSRGMGNLPAHCYRFYGVLQTRGSSLLSLPRVAFHSLKQPHAKFILEVGHPVPETKECCSRAFLRFICFIKGPIVFSLKQDYPAGISCSAWVRKTGTLHFQSELLLPAEMH